MMLLPRFNVPEILLKLLLSFLWASFQLTLSNLPASFEFPSSLFEVSYELIFICAPFDLASSSFELHPSCLLLMSFLQALISLSFKLPRASLKHCFELPSSLPSASFRLNLNFLWLSLRFPWALLQNYLKLAWNFLQACFLFPSGCFQAPCKLPQVSIAIPRKLLQTCFQLASCSLQAAFELLWSLLWACFRHSSNWEAQNLKTLVLCLASTGFRSPKP